MPLLDASHPFWRILMGMLLIVLVLGIQYFNASEFSADDIARWVQTILVVFGLRGIESKVTKH